MAKRRELKAVRHYVRAWRNYRGLTQERLAERVDRSRGLISQIESGETELTEQMIYAMAEALSCEPGDLLSVDPVMQGEVVDLLRLIRERDMATVRAIISAIPPRTGTDG